MTFQLPCQASDIFSCEKRKWEAEGNGAFRSVKKPGWNVFPECGAYTGWLTKVNPKLQKDSSKGKYIKLELEDYIQFGQMDFWS